MGVKEQRPRARKEGLLIERLPDEVLVYDLDRKKAHCLNGSAALIWNHCDGKTSVEGILGFLKQKFREKVSDDVVWLGLDQLYEARLIETRVVRPGVKGGMSRRDLVKRIGVAVSIPLVASILAPTASAGLSCVGRPCAAGCGACTCLGVICS
jgi:coenzyme PQQ synthesis protein D (PqqD)